MKKIFPIIAVFAIVISLVMTIDTSVAKKADLLPCCNNKDPRDYPTFPDWSWLCFENGGWHEIQINWNQCYCLWELNNWNPPDGKACAELQKCTNK